MRWSRARRYEIGLAAISLDCGHYLFEKRGAIGTLRDDFDVCTQNIVEKPVAGTAIGRAFIRHHVGEHERGAEARRDGCGRSLPRMVRLQRTGGNEGIAAFGNRLTDQKFELARLVAATRKACAVIALDEEARA